MYLLYKTRLISKVPKCAGTVRDFRFQTVPAHFKQSRHIPNSPGTLTKIYQTTKTKCNVTNHIKNGYLLIRMIGRPPPPSRYENQMYRRQPTHPPPPYPPNIYGRSQVQCRYTAGGRGVIRTKNQKRGQKRVENR